MEICVMVMPKDSALMFTEILHNIAVPFDPPKTFICFNSSDVPNIVNNPNMKYGIRTSNDIIWYKNEEFKIKIAWFTMEDKFFNDLKVDRWVGSYSSYMAIPLNEFNKKELLKRIYVKKFKKVWPFRITFDVFNDEIILNTHKARVRATFKFNEYQKALDMCNEWHNDAATLNEKLELFKHAFKRK